MKTSNYLKKTFPSQNSEKENEDDPKTQFNNLETTVENFKKTHYETIEEEINKIEESLTNLTNYQNLDQQKQDIHKLRTRFASSEKEIEEIDSEFKKKLSKIVEIFRENLNEFRVHNRRFFSEFSKESFDRISALKLAITKSRKKFQDQLNSVMIKINAEIEEVRDRIKMETQDREQSARGIEMIIISELDKMEEEISIDRKVKEKTNFKIKLIIEDLNNELDKRIEAEKKEREVSNNSLLILLEEVCNRIEGNFAEF